MKRLIFAFPVLFVFLVNPSFTYAKTSFMCCIDHTVNPSTCYGLDDTNNVTCIADIFPPAQYFGDLSSIVNVLLPNLVLIAGIILFLLVIVAGFQMITSAGSGDAKATEKWRNMLIYGIVGFLIVLFAYGIIQLVEYFTGATILNPEKIIK
jgi:hypothetical protein